MRGALRTILSTWEVIIHCACQWKRNLWWFRKRSLNWTFFWKRAFRRGFEIPCRATWHFLVSPSAHFRQLFGSSSHQTFVLVSTAPLPLPNVLRRTFSLPFSSMWSPGGTLFMNCFHVLSRPPVWSTSHKTNPTWTCPPNPPHMLSCWEMVMLMCMLVWMCGCVDVWVCGCVDDEMWRVPFQRNMNPT